LIGQYGSHFVSQTTGHEIDDVVGATVVLEQHFFGHIDRHVFEQIDGHPDGPRLQHLTGQNVRHFEIHISGHGDVVGVVDRAGVVVCGQHDTGQDGVQDDVHSTGHVMLTRKPGQHFTGQSGPQCFLQFAGQLLESGSIMIVTGFGVSALLQHSGEHGGRHAS